MEKFGYTTGCPGCRAVNRGTTAANHSEECRSRIAEELEKVGDVRLERENERLFEYLEEEEKKKAGASAKEKEDKEKKTGVSAPSASSSGQATAQENGPRSRGGVPMATDSGVGVHEIVKRKAGDVGQEVGEDMKDKKNKTGEEEERGAKRSVNEWEEFAKRLKTNADERAEGSKNPGEGMDISQSQVTR